MLDSNTVWWRFTVKALLLMGINTLVQAFWVTLEITAYGAPQPRAVDNIIGLALSASLYCNLRHRTKIGGT